jgi:hypothetical protein
MGNMLIFMCQASVTDCEGCSSLLDWKGCLTVPGNSTAVKTVPQTDTGGLVEYTKALERMMLKELGNLPP